MYVEEITITVAILIRRYRTLELQCPGALPLTPLIVEVLPNPALIVWIMTESNYIKGAILGSRDISHMEAKCPFYRVGELRHTKTQAEIAI